MNSTYKFLHIIFILVLFISKSAIGQTNYYVNDNSTDDDRWCSAIGDDSNNGTDPSTPKLTLHDILTDYDLGGDDTVFIDNGIYNWSEVKWSTIAYGGNDYGTGVGDELVIIGAGSSGSAITNITCTSGDLFVVDNESYDYIQFLDMKLTGATDGKVIYLDFADYVLIDNCDISTIGVNSSAAVRLRMSSSYCIISDNTISFTGTSWADHVGAISFDQASITDNIVTRNKIDGNGVATRGILVNEGGDRHTFSNNYISNFIQGIVFIHGTINTNIYNNSFYCQKRGFQAENNVISNNVLNNIFHIYGTESDDYCMNFTANGAQFNCDYNIYYCGGPNIVWWSANKYASLNDWHDASYDHDDNSLEADPNYNDPTNGNLSFDEGDPAENKGVTGLVIVDVEGTPRNNPPEIGAFEIAEPLSVQITDKSDPDCKDDEDGTIDITVTGGTKPYTFSWTGGATTEDLSALDTGTYTVTVTDNNAATATASTTITEPALLRITNIQELFISCYGKSDGTLTAYASGGTETYSYLWSNDSTSQKITGVGGGTYTITVTDNNNCSASQEYTMNEPDSLQITNITGTDISCTGSDDGTVSIDVSGGTKPYTFIWSNGSNDEDIDSLPPATYNITVLDLRFCIASDSYTITEPSQLQITNIAGTHVTCNGADDGTIDITVADGTLPYTFLWSNDSTTDSINNLASGTYTVTVTDNNNCIDTNQYEITEPALLQVTNITGTHVSTCGGVNDGTIDVTVAGGTLPHLFLWSNDSTKEDIDNLSPGTYTVTVSDNNNCTATDSYAITEPTSLVITDISGTHVSCSSTSDGTISVAFSGGTEPITFLWSNDSTTDSIGNLAGGTYTLTITDNNLCRAVDSYTINEPALLQISEISRTHITCNGADDGNIDISVNGGTQPYTILWSNDSTKEDIGSLAPDTYTITVNDINNCTVINQYVITEPNQMQITEITDTQITCFGINDGAISIKFSGGTQPFNFLWSNDSTEENIDSLAPGIYTVTVTDNNNCIAVDSIAITEPELLQVSNINGTNITCNGANDGKIDITLSGGTQPYSYLWSNDSIAEDIDSLPPAIYTVIVTDSNNCSDTSQYTITEPALLEISNTATHISSCGGVNDGTINVTASGGVQPYSFLWSNDSTINNIVNLAAGNYTITVTDSNNCSATDSYAITEPTSMTITDISGTHVSCSGASDGEVSIVFSGGDQPYIFKWSNDSTSQNIGNLAGGTYTITITDNNLCRAVDSYIINEPALLGINLSATHVLCYGDNDGTVSTSISGGTPPYTYLWSDNSTLDNLSGLAGDTYTVTVTDNNLCTTKDSFEITEPLRLSINSSSTHITCAGANNGVLDITVIGGIQPYSYLWSNDSTNEVINNLLPDTYTVTVTDFNGCTVSDSATITEAEAITVIINDYSICDGSVYDIDPGTGYDSYLWSTNASTQTITVNIAGTYTVTVTDSSSCIGIDSMTLTVNSNPVADITPDDTTIYIGQSIDLLATGGNTYLWNTGSQTAGVVASPQSSSIYIVTVTDNNNCNGIDSVIISVNEEASIFIPTAFSPNEDGFNDVLYLRGKGIANFELRIFNRWGQEIFRSTSLDEGWDGTYQNKKLNPAVFVYTLVGTFSDGTGFNESGNVSLVR